jgi:hypothetical protein
VLSQRIEVSVQHVVCERNVPLVPTRPVVTLVAADEHERLAQRVECEQRPHRAGPQLLVPQAGCRASLPFLGIVSRGFNGARGETVVTLRRRSNLDAARLCVIVLIAPGWLCSDSFDARRPSCPAQCSASWRR